jgi:hypothetical protein
MTCWHPNLQKDKYDPAYRYCPKCKKAFQMFVTFVRVYPK